MIFALVTGVQTCALPIYKFRVMLAAGAKPNSDGVKYPVNKRRFDDFFTALSCGLIYKSQKSPLPTSYRIGHIYHAFTSDADPAVQLLEAAIGAFYSGPPIDSFDFGKPNLQNERIYTAEIFGHAGLDRKSTRLNSSH